MYQYERQRGKRTLQPPPIAGLGALGLDVERAIRNNRIYGQTAGWQPHYERIARLLGFTTYIPDEATFALAVARWQAGRGLNPDGVLGPGTWRAMRPLLGLNGLGPAAPAPAPAPSGFAPTPVELPGGGRIKDRTVPSPADLVSVQGTGGRRIPLHRLAADAYLALLAAARRDGIEAPLLLPTSGFRDPRRQAELWQQALVKYGSPEKARKWVAPPGGSAHQTGRAIDLHLGGANSSANAENLRTTRAYRWLAAHAERFGFYPYVVEPWHWEYNPPAAGQRAASGGLAP